MQNSSDKMDRSLAGFWVRAAAYAVDKMIVGAGLLILDLMLSGISGFLSGAGLDGNLLFQYTWKDIILYLAGVAYFILCTYYTGTTVGKRLFQLRVVSADGEKPSLTDVIYRETIGRFLCGIVMMVGYLMAGLDAEKRGLHDILCDTRVVYARKVKVIPVPDRRAPGNFREPYPYSGPENMAPGATPYSSPENVAPEAGSYDSPENMAPEANPYDSSENMASGASLYDGFRGTQEGYRYVGRGDKEKDSNES